jgi:LysR family nitrogen assimilation transcriptional regulator
MDLRHLKYFIAAYEHGSLSRAATDIPISQPAITRSLKQLEDELGVSLLKRHARGVVPTNAGERFYLHAKSILAECARAGQDALDAGDQVSGEVSIGVASLFTYTMMDRVVAGFCERHPKVKVTVVQGLLEDLLAGLEHGDIELALCNFPVQSLPDSHILETLVELKIFPYVSRDHPLADSKTVSWKTVADARWVNFSQPHSQEAFAAPFINENLAPPQTPLLTNSMLLVKSMILKWGFIGLLPEQLMVDEIEAGALVKLRLPGIPITRNAGLIMRRDGYRRPVAELFAEEIRNACKSIYRTD